MVLYYRIEIMLDKSLKNREVILQYHSVGPYVKVTAMDVESLTEISIQGPASLGEEGLKRNALKRLEYVLRKKGIVE